MSRRNDSSSPICRLEKCGKPIMAQQRREMVVLQNGVMHGECYREHQRQVQESMQRAIAEGRHSEPAQMEQTR